MAERYPGSMRASRGLFSRVMDAPGWDAIDAAATRIYGAQEPKHWGTLIRWSLGGPDPLDGISCYEADGHWHFVSYGISDLYEKGDPGDPESGYGFELTFRLARKKGETAPPEWTLVMLQRIARYVFETGNVLLPGEHVELGGPLGEEDASLSALAVVEDPELGAIDTRHGHVRFLQLVGITGDELEAMKDWNSEGVIALLGKRDSMYVTDVRRKSIRQDPDVEAHIRAGIARDGSSHGAAFTQQLDWTRNEDGSLHLLFGAIAVPDVRRALRSRLPFARPFRVYGPRCTVVLWPAGVTKPADEIDDDVLFIELSAEQAEALHEALDERPDRYRCDELPGLVVEVEASDAPAPELESETETE